MKTVQLFLYCQGDKTKMLEIFSFILIKTTLF